MTRYVDNRIISSMSRWATLASLNLVVSILQEHYGKYISKKYLSIENEFGQKHAQSNPNVRSFEEKLCEVSI